MNTIPQTVAQFFQLPRGGAERTRPAPQPTFSSGKILNGATIQTPVRSLDGLTGAVKRHCQRKVKMSGASAKLKCPLSSSPWMVGSGFGFAPWFGCHGRRA